MAHTAGDVGKKSPLLTLAHTRRQVTNFIAQLVTQTVHRAIDEVEGVVSWFAMAEYCSLFSPFGERSIHRT